jgi:hypothetical protein
MIILEADRLPGASMADLQETFLAVTGNQLDTELHQTAAKVRVEMALLTSSDIVGHLGFQDAAKPQPMTLQQLRNKGKEMNKQQAVENEIARFQPGSLAAQLFAAQEAASKIEPRPKKEPSGEKRAKIAKVKATHAGKSKPQAGSLRCAVLNWIHAQPEGIADVDAMEKALGYPVRGHVQKLIEKDHLTVHETIVPESTGKAAPAGEVGAGATNGEQVGETTSANDETAEKAAA